MSAIDMKSLSGLKENDLVRLGNCAICRKRMLGGAAGPTFYKISISRGMFDRRALERRAGLEMMLGNGVLAKVMGPNDDLAKIFDGPHDVIVHEDCARNIGHILNLIPQKEE